MMIFFEMTFPDEENVFVEYFYKRFQKRTHSNVAQAFTSHTSSMVTQYLQIIDEQMKALING